MRIHTMHIMKSAYTRRLDPPKYFLLRLLENQIMCKSIASSGRRLRKTHFVFKSFLDTAVHNERENLVESRQQQGESYQDPSSRVLILNALPRIYHFYVHISSYRTCNIAAWTITKVIREIDIKVINGRRDVIKDYTCLRKNPQL